MEGILSQKEIDALLGVGGDEDSATEEQSTASTAQPTKKNLVLKKEMINNINGLLSKVKIKNVYFVKWIIQ